jgi:hypothetical protein
MCYSSCPYENFHGECIQPKMRHTKYAHCYVEHEEFYPDDYEEDDYYEEDFTTKFF